MLGIAYLLADSGPIPQPPFCKPYAIGECSRIAERSAKTPDISPEMAKETRLVEPPAGSLARSARRAVAD
jgi:hypothetical protein